MRYAAPRGGDGQKRGGDEGADTCIRPLIIPK